MSRLSNINSLVRSAEPDASPARRRRAISGRFGGALRAGVVIAVCGAGALVSTGVASARSMNVSSWNSYPSGQVVTLTNQATGMVAEDPAYNGNQGVQQDLWSANETDGELHSATNQAWVLNQQPDGDYEIVNRESGMCLEDEGNSTTAGSPIDQWPCWGGSNQEWNLQSTTGYNVLINDDSGMTLEPSNTSRGAGLVQEPFAYGSPIQSWNIQPTTYELLSNQVTVPRAGTHADNNTYTCNSGYHFMPGDEGSEDDYTSGTSYYFVAFASVGDVVSDLDTYNFTAPFTKNASGSSVSPIYYGYDIGPSSQIGQSMLFCLPNSDHNYVDNLFDEWDRSADGGGI
jgi:hypothetical protein